jgi:hypothetical protein
LKSALDTSAGGRNGLSVTLPVSYRYLQHFDLAKLQASVDFFNIMSYDLHGTRDEGENWTQPSLNSHTNLTEITEHLDVLWGNDIDPGKVTLGLAFYSRTFGLADPSCTLAGGACYFHSGGAPGRCSNNVGTLMGAEVAEMLHFPDIQPTLDTAAAVKVFSYKGDWITFDDEDTFKLKVEFAKSQCLGGVMVWAVSQDSAHSMSLGMMEEFARKMQASGHNAVLRPSYSRQLQAATGFTSPGVSFDATKGQREGDMDSRVQRNQCRWTGCSESCGPGYYPVHRTDEDRHSDTEYMVDSTNCRDGSVHTLCCPVSGPYAECGWYGFQNGDCTGVCPSGFTQVGSSRVACRSNRPQVACCTTRTVDHWGQDSGEITATALYANCNWEGSNDGVSCLHREGDKCANGKPPLVASRFGSGGAFCTGDTRVLYCCREQTDVKQWANCYWQKSKPDSSGYCHPTCPYGEVRVAMESVPPGCSSGGRAYCCTPVYKTDDVSAMSDMEHIALIQEALEVFFANPHCDNAAIPGNT